MKHTTSVTPERTGFCAQCTCGWGPAWAAARHNAERLGREHKTKFEKKERE